MCRLGEMVLSDVVEDVVSEGFVSWQLKRLDKRQEVLQKGKPRRASTRWDQATSGGGKGAAGGEMSSRGRRRR